jgi:1-acyl-sn-glycerol-3-phosphate acyltransferase
MKLFRPTYIGIENIPRDGSFVLAGNHTSKLDAFLIMPCTKRCIHCLAKIELFKGIKKYFFKGLGVIPVDRKRKNPEVMDLSVKYLMDNRIIGLFPEGTINRTDDIILPFKYGAVSMAKKTNSLLVPFGITGDYKFRSKNLVARFGKPFEVGDMSLEEANEKLEKAIGDLMKKSIKEEKNKGKSKK